MIIRPSAYRVMLLLRPALRGQVGVGWALEIECFLGPVKWHRADRRVECHLELNRPARAAQVHKNLVALLRPPSPIHTGLWTEQLRNQQRHIKYIIYASGT
jgi:hypothetical protein